MVGDHIRLSLDEVLSIADVRQLQWERNEALRQMQAIGLTFGSDPKELNVAMQKQKGIRISIRKYRNQYFGACPCSPNIHLNMEESRYCSKCGQKLLGLDVVDVQLEMFRKEQKK